MSASPKNIIVLGALSAIGEETCRLLAEEGAALALFARNAERLEIVARDLRARGARNAFAFTRDLADADNAAADLQAAMEAMGGADAVLIFYGVLGEQARAESDLGEARKLLDVNFTSAAIWALAGADLLERSGSGVLLGVSSVAGDRGRRSNYIYGAAKGGFSILLQGIAHRFAAKAKGPRAIVVKAGFVDTPMTAQFKKGALWATPEQIARIIHRAMRRRQSVVYAPWIWRWIMLVIRLLPRAIFDRLNL